MVVSLHHIKEWVNSAVDLDLIRLNVESLEGQEAVDRLLVGDVPRRNDGRVRDHILKKVAHCERGGWWVQGVGLWGQFKPDKPRRCRQTGKPIKYEAPQRLEATLYCLKVPIHLWGKIAKRYGVLPYGEDFWQWVSEQPQLPITITEGAKKAGALLTAGYIAIALPGIWMGIRSPKNEQGEKIGDTRLIPALDRFAVPGREFQFAFDQDAKPKTVQQVNKAITATGWALKQKDCSVSVLSWSPQLGKGIDDVIAQHGCTTLDDLYNRAANFENWKARSYSQLTYEPHVLLNRRYLGELTLPKNARLVGIKSAKGTGKTESLISVVAEAQSNGQKVLVLTHRIQLGQALCDRFGLDYVTELKTSETRGVFGYGLCADSLHPESQARFKAEDWEDCLVIVDEVEQVIWHLLNSSTCQRNRVAILKSFKALLQNAQRIIVADADLSDTSLDYLIKLLGRAAEPYVIRNDWQPGDEHRWEVQLYTDGTPASLVARLETELSAGGKALCLCSGQKAKSRWGTQALEAYFKNLFPDLRILRIDSESIAEPNHPAYGCIGQLNDILGRYDLVLASPSIETGVSIDLKGHFTACFGIFQGIQPINSACQMLARLRESVPRFIWASGHGIGKISRGELSVTSIQATQHKLARANIHRLLEAGLEITSESFQVESVECWAKMAVRINAGMVRYRDSLTEALVAEGHCINDEGEADNAKDIKLSVTATKEEIYETYCEAIASSADISEKDYEALKDQRAKSAEERHQARKYELQQRYGEVTSDLVRGDDEGLYSRLRLHYYLTLGKNHVTARDKRAASAQVEQGKGDVWRPDFNAGQLGLKVKALEVLGVPALLDSERELRNSDSDLQDLARLAKSNPYQIKIVLGVAVREKDSPIAILQRIMNRLGLKLNCIKMEGSQGNRQRVYQIEGLEDGRSEIFQRWLERDTAFVEAECASASPAVAQLAQPLVHTLGNKEITIPSACTDQTPIESQEETTAGRDNVQNRWAIGALVRVVTTNPLWAHVEGAVGKISEVSQLGSRFVVELSREMVAILTAEDLELVEAF